jgi:hypothetical protein
MSNHSWNKERKMAKNQTAHMRMADAIAEWKKKYTPGM